MICPLIIWISLVLRPFAVAYTNVSIIYIDVQIYETRVGCSALSKHVVGAPVLTYV